MRYTDEQVQRTAEQLLHIASDELVDGSLLKSLKQATGGSSWRECLAILAGMLKGERE